MRFLRFLVVYGLPLSSFLNAQFVPAPKSPFGPALGVGISPSSLAVADFDGDGKPDLAVANLITNTVTVLQGDGMGGFKPFPFSPLSVGQNPVFVAALPLRPSVGFYPDLVVVNSGSDNISVLLNDGHGGFKAAPGSPFSTSGNDPRSVAIGNFDGDQNPDLAITNYQSGTVALLRGNGMGGFAPFPNKSPTVAAGTNPVSIVAVNFDITSPIGLAVANQNDNINNVVNGSVTLLKGDGSGGFAPFPSGPLLFPVQTSPVFIAASDLNGDGFPDLVIASATSNLVTVFLNNRSGTFYQAPGSPIQLPSMPSALVVQDLNGDLIPDLAIASTNGTVMVLTGVGQNNTGTGAFTAPATSFSTAAGSTLTSIGVGGFNGDGKPELVVTDGQRQNVILLLNTNGSPPVLVSAASDSGPVAPGSLVSIYGFGLASTATAPPGATTGSASQGGSTVTITDAAGVSMPLQLFYAAPSQINAYVPQGFATGQATFAVSTATGLQSGAVMLNSVAPSLFSANQTGKGVANGMFIPDVISNPNPTPVYTCSNGASACPGQYVPAQLKLGSNSALILYGTGIRNRAHLSDVTVSINGQALPVSVAAPVPPATLGLDEVMVSLPPTLAGNGTVFVSVSVAGTTSNQVTLNFQ